MLIACILVVVPTALFLLRPKWVFGTDEVLASVILMTITMLGVGLLIALTYLIERRRKYALVAVVFGAFLFLFFATIAISILSGL